MSNVGKSSALASIQHDALIKSIQELALGDGLQPRDVFRPELLEGILALLSDVRPMEERPVHECILYVAYLLTQMPHTD